MKKISEVTIKVIVEHDEDFDVNELGVVRFIDNTYTDDYEFVPKDDEFQIIEYKDTERIEVNQ